MATDGAVASRRCGGEKREGRMAAVDIPARISREAPTARDMAAGAVSWRGGGCHGGGGGARHGGGER